MAGVELCATIAPVYRDDPRLVALIGPGGPFEVAEVDIDGIALRCFVRVPATIVDCFQAGRSHADLVHLVHGDERLSFAEIHDGARRLGRELRDSFGVGRGDRVAIVMRNLPEYVVAFWAAALNGAIVVPVNSWGAGPELRYAIDNAGATVAFVDPDRLDRIVAGGRPEGVALVGVRGAVGDAPYAELLHGEPLADDELVGLGPDDPVTIMYTSGTTGRPKGALATSRNHVSNLINMGFVNAREAVLAGREPRPPRQTASLAAGPLFHIGGIAGIIGGQLGGSKMVLMAKWDVDEALRLAAAEDVTTLGGVPAMARQVLEHPRIAELGLDVTGVPLGGAAVAPDLPLKAIEVFGEATQIFNGYGLTETTSAVVANVGVEFAARPRSVGRANLTADVKIVGPGGDELGSGEVGEICMRSPQVVAGYWNDPEATRASFVDGWFHSGDLGYLDDDGYLYVVDRLKDVVIRGGENVYCAEIEAVLHDHPDIAEVAIVGLDDEAMGERVCAVVVPRAGAAVTLAEIRAFTATQLAGFKCPEALVVLDGELPKTATSKIAKNELRQLVGDPATAIERWA